MGIAVAVVAVFLLSNLTVRVLAALMKGITTGYLDAETAGTPAGASETLG